MLVFIQVRSYEINKDSIVSQIHNNCFSDSIIVYGADNIITGDSVVIYYSSTTKIINQSSTSNKINEDCINSTIIELSLNKITKTTHLLDKWEIKIHRKNIKNTESISLKSLTLVSFINNVNSVFKKKDFDKIFYSILAQINQVITKRYFNVVFSIAQVGNGSTLVRPPPILKA